MWAQHCETSTLLDVQQNRLQFLKCKSAVLERYLQELRAQGNHLPEVNLDLTSRVSDERDLLELEMLNNEIDKLKTECYCLSYQVDVYSGSLPGGLIDYLPDQPSPLDSPMDTSERIIISTSNDRSSDPHTTSSSNGMIYDEPYSRHDVHHNHGREPNEPTRMEARRNENTRTASPRPSTSRHESQTKSIEAEEEEGEKWTCPKCSFANHPLIEACELCEHQRHCYPGNIGGNTTTKPCTVESCKNKSSHSSCYCHLEKP